MRRRITLLVAATTSVVLLAFLLPSAFLVTRVAEARALDAGRQQLQFLIPTVGLGTADEVRTELAQLDEGGRTVAVRTPEGEWLGVEGVTSGAAPTSPTEIESAEGVRLVQPVERIGGVALIEVLVPRDQLRAGVARTWVVLAGLGIVLFFLALLVADRLARSLTRPVTDLAGTAHRLGSGDLAARVEPAGPPEVREVGTAFNQLAGRIGELLAAERESAADLAHRLRTPLTALRLDAEALPPADRDRVLDDVDALGRTVDEIIREARRPVREGLGASCDATAVVAERVAFWSALAEEEGREVAVDLPEGPLPVRLAETDLVAALDVLLGNVFAHTPEGTGFRVSVFPRDGGGAEVDVADSGPGMREGSIERGRSGGGSTGLGLDIARRTAESSGGGLQLWSSPSGSTVTLELGPPS